MNAYTHGQHEHILQSSISYFHACCSPMCDMLKYGRLLTSTWQELKCIICLYLTIQPQPGQDNRGHDLMLFAIGKLVNQMWAYTTAKDQYLPNEVRERVLKWKRVWGGGEREGGRGREERESCREHSDFNIHEHAFIKE